METRHKLRSRKKRLQIDPAVSTTNSVPTTSTVTDNTSSLSQDEVHSSAAATGDSNEAQSTSSTRNASASPEPNCPICLGKLENKSFTDSCFHMFCFVCLVEWSKVKAECPLCKQSFKSIVHNVRSYKEYEQYHIQRPEDNARNLRLEMHDFSMPGGERFRYRTTVTDHRYANITNRLEQELANFLSFHRPSRRDPVSHYRRRRQAANSEFRRSIYQQNLKLTNEQMNTRRRVRDTSPTFFRENPAQTHRLVPWLNREINALLPGHGDQSAFVLELIIDLIKRYPIVSEEFHQHVYPFFGRNTHQFMQEFLAFAKSPYHMAAYDRHISYEQNDQPNHDSDSDHERPDLATDGNDSDVIVVSPCSLRPGDTNARGDAPQRIPHFDSSLTNWGSSILTAENPSYLGFAPIVRSYGQDDLTDRSSSMHRFERPTGRSGWDSPTQGPSSLFGGGLDDLGSSHSHLGSIWTPSSSSISAPATPLQSISTSLADRVLMTVTNMQPLLPPTPPIPSTSVGNPIICKESDSDSNSSDIMIVDYEKPWTERSPIKLSSAEESDPDLVIVGTSHINDPVKKERKKKKKKKEHESHKDNESDHRTKRSRDDIDDGYLRHKNKKSRHHSRTRLRLLPHTSSRSRTNSRSHSRSPSSMKPRHISLYPSGYKHKKFSHFPRSDTFDDPWGDRQHDDFLPRDLHLSRSRSMSSSSSDCSPENESQHVSITAHKHRSSSRHSSFEIVEYRKKSSKYKKAKKHKSTKEGHKEKKKHHDKEKSDNLSSSKHKKSSKTKHKKDKKKEKYHKDKNNEHVSKDVAIPEESVSESGKKENSTCKAQVVEKGDAHKRKLHTISDYTSDSDPDSEIDIEHFSEPDDDLVKDVQPVSELGRSTVQQSLKSQQNNEVLAESAKNMTDSQLEKPVPSSAVFDNLEFVELSSELAAVDDELESITRCLDSSDKFGKINTDLKQPKTFKKHPHGHKKSSQTSSKHHLDHGQAGVPFNVGPVSVNHISTEPVNTAGVNSYNCNSVKKTSNYGDDIQFNDITSCTDGFDPYLPSFLSFMDKTRTIEHKEQPKLLKNYTTSSQRVSPSFGDIITEGDHGRKNHFGDKRFHNFDIVDIEQIHSDDSDDIDVVGYESTKISPSQKKRSQRDTQHCRSHKVCDGSPKPGCSQEVDEDIDVLGLSDSDATLEFMGEDKQSIDISEDNNCEVEVISDQSDNEIDVMKLSDEEVVLSTGENSDELEEKQEKLETYEESTDLDYSCEDDNDDFGSCTDGGQKNQVCDQVCEKISSNSYTGSNHKYLNKGEAPVAQNTASESNNIDKNNQSTFTLANVTYQSETPNSNVKSTNSSNTKNVVNTSVTSKSSETENENYVEFPATNILRSSTSSSASEVLPSGSSAGVAGSSDFADPDWRDDIHLSASFSPGMDNALSLGSPPSSPELTPDHMSMFAPED